MIVMKFGGSSVANADRIRHIAEIIKEYREQRPVVVLSAMGDTTDDLIEAADLALTGKVLLDKTEKLHLDTAKALGIPDDEVKKRLGELRTPVSYTHLTLPTTSPV